MSVPNEDGSFTDIKRQATFIKGSSLYQFEIIGPNRAKFEFIPDEINTRDVKYQPETLLEPVCEIENKEIKEVKAVENLRPGIVELVGNKWVVTNKSCVRFK